MKKKENQTNTKKALTICGLSALCIAALAGAYLLTREPDTEFVPASTETGSLTDSWEENANVSLPTTTDSESTQVTGSSSDQTQTVISEDESGSVSTLSDSSSKEDAAAESLRKSRKPRMIPPIRTSSRDMRTMYPSPPLLLLMRPTQILPIPLQKKVPTQMSIPVRSMIPCSDGLIPATPHRITWTMTATSINRSVPWAAIKPK